MPESGPDTTVLVSPVYLAGEGSAEPALRPLLEAGFRHEYDAQGNARLTSPTERHRVDYMPRGLTQVKWRISEGPDRYTPPTWQATFTDNTPPEVVAAFTTALTQNESPWPGGRRPRADDVLRPLADAGWRRRETEWEIDFTSPDHLATVSYDTTPGHPLDPGYEPWLISGARNLGHGHDWYGAFTTHTPTRLVTAVATRLSSPDPAPRTNTETLHPEATVTHGASPSSAPTDTPRASAARSRTRATAGDSRPQPSAMPTPQAQAANARPQRRR
ncbi:MULTISPECIES: DUF317 domain-containing protein [unclassified Streptomyces]|uniref:DUF317 domain-containing protein n=1 Tax=unclassified Streptomyces TaxID=2593676 RepID=UPI002DDC056D|nr:MULTISPECIES: DUF317 domain-containing protein [unclassified Streptomyces]WSA96682.1 DUF317 domain-containing protein [Streptomyces sp. NBC_01795]WSB81097.1 DUF317 domain-containing protein [Streptomyces sp. NBC_01775]WSS10691.1 DUF317 domain-containing protein [Streptomyces sp. NBC_01186]WSS39388.1 DUF317 domain-containing protein [Streptomyces sp. NBC_01187]